MPGNPERPERPGPLIEGGPSGFAPLPDQAEVPSTRWRMRNWRLRWKLLIVLMVPLITAIALGAMRVSGQLASADVYDRINQEIALTGSLSNVIDALQREREDVSLFAASQKQQGQGPGGAQTQQVDAAVATFRQQAAAASNLDPVTQSAINDALNALGDLDSLRTSVSATQYPEVAILNGYDQMLAVLLQSSAVTEPGAADQRFYPLSNALNDLRQAKEQYTRGNAILIVTAAENAITPNSGFPPLQQNALNSADAQFDASITAFNSTVSQADREMYANTVAGPPVDNRSRLAELIQIRAESVPPQAINVSAGDMQAAGDGGAALMRDAEHNMYNELLRVTQGLSSGAKQAAVRDGAIVALALILAFLVTLFVARSLVQSLRTLRAGALDVARTRLPQSVQRILADPDPIKASAEAVEPVPVFSSDEIGEVARSFDVVHEQAVRLAAEQAVLRDNVNAIFINLSRRSQALVERQLALIDRLERDEQDPDQLANLFELDHLATRMRRNSESLLVLSGSGLAKRMSQPVPIGDLVGAAVSEVEQYARIEVGAPPKVSVLGRVVNDLIHLVAELLDNATAFSEPNTKVAVRIARTRAREVAIQITDRGVGMSEEDVRVANEKLANPPEMDVSVSRRMGLYVVARLAKRHGIRVKLRANEDIDGGTVALVVIPEELIHGPNDAPGPQTSAVGQLPPLIEHRPPAESGVAGAAAAAAGIAGAFGLASSRAANRSEADAEQALREQEAAFPGTSSLSSPSSPSSSPSSGGLSGLNSGAKPAPPEAPAEISGGPATAYWTNEFEPNTGEQPAVDEPSFPEPAIPAQSASEASALWEAHTAADALPPVPAEPPVSQAEQPLTARLNSGEPQARADSSQEVDAPTERLPIYEAVLSQWFRPDASAPAEPGEEPPAAAPPAPAPATPPAPQPPATSGAEAMPLSSSGTDRPAPLPTRIPGRAGKAAGFGLSKTTPEPESAPAPEPTPTPVAATNGHGANGHTSTRDDTWQTPADEGWQAAEALLAPVSEVTTAGLPKRVPRAHLVPGSAAAPPPPSPESAPPPLPPRSAEAVRGRMSSFQQGVRRGRHALIEAYSGSSTQPSHGRRDEEHE